MRCLFYARNEVIQILTIRDYNNIEYPLLARKTYASELNGNDDLQLKVYQQNNNSLDLHSIDKLWEIEYLNKDYKITYIKKNTGGKGFNLDVTAVPLFSFAFDKSIIHENHDGSHTANNAFRIVFEGTEFNFVLVDFSPAVSWEGFGKGRSRLEMFRRLVDRYNYEFEIQGKTVYMRHRIGNDTNFMYKYKLNASNVSSTMDANSYFTYVRGFGDFEEGEEDYYNNAQLKPEPYVSPLADVVGLWEGPPIVDGRMTQLSTIEAAMQEAVEGSLAVTVEGTLHDVRKMGYETAVPVKGDRVWLHDERINLEQEIRLHKIVTTYDEKDNIIGCDVTFGSQSIGERHKANINTLSKRFADLLTGKLKLPIISIEQIGMDMINAIHAASSEIIFGDFGMQAISKTNPNHVFGVNSEGWYISQDGGATPRTIATAEGIYADALFAGTLWLTNDLNIEGQTGYLNITGERFVMRSKTDPEKYFEITPDGALANHGFLSVTRPDAYTDSNGKEWGRWIQDGIPQSDMDMQRNQFMYPDVVSWSGQRYLFDTANMTSNQMYTCETVYSTHNHKFMRVGVGLNVLTAWGMTLKVEVIEFGSGNIVGTWRRYVPADGEVIWSNITLDLGVPDFESRKSFYISAGIESDSNSSVFGVLINRVSGNG